MTLSKVKLASVSLLKFPASVWTKIPGILYRHHRHTPGHTAHRSTFCNTWQAKAKVLNVVYKANDHFKSQLN